MQWSIPYRQFPFESSYGPTTSMSNFCEEDFIVTSEIGEFINTLSNIAYVIYASRGLHNLKSENATLTAQAPYYSLALVGMCSALFHAVLKQYAQFADDTSMLVASACVLHRAYTFDKSPASTKTFTTILITLLGIETAYHVAADEETVHQLSFLALILLVAIKTRSLISTRVKDDKDKQRFTKKSLFGLAAFLFGYFLWQMDFIFCSELNALKRQIGMPWGFVLELHGWWHILTAIGAYTFMHMVEKLTARDVVVPKKASD